MNENHARHLLTTFRHIENLLSETEHLLATAGSSSPFAEYTQDSSPVQRKVIHDYIERVHQAMHRALADLNLPQPRPICGALWAAQNHVNFAKIAVAEMEPKRLRGYGTLDESDATAIDSIVAELNSALEQLSAYLSKGSDLNLQARLERLEQTRDEVRLLRELERVIAAHGLVEFRTPLALLLSRLEHPIFEIGLFGRVSSGKSSLLNYLLAAEVLPVGVTPVTAIPTRVQFGATPRATVRLAHSQPVQIELAQLADYSTEQRNPANAKHVTEIVVEVPSERLRQGVTFVDTPGLGSLATAGAAETMAYLPRCDLGMVLVDAASTLTHEDLIIVQALYQSGAKAMVLLSKADLLRAADRQQAISYAQRKLASELGIEGAVYPVSVIGADAKLCEQWFERDLLPVLNAHHEQLSASLKRKIGNLRQGVIKTFEARVRTSTSGNGMISQQTANEALTALRKTDALFEAAETQTEGVIESIVDLGNSMVEAAAAELAAIWTLRGTQPDETAEAIKTAFGRVVRNQASKIVDALESLRQQLDGTLIECQKATRQRDTGREPLLKPTGMPIYEGAGLLDQQIPTRPKMHLLGQAFVRRQIRHNLDIRLGEGIQAMLNDYRQRLRHWSHRQLTELRGAFQERSAALRVQLEVTTAQQTRESDLPKLVADLASLRNS